MRSTHILLLVVSLLASSVAWSQQLLVFPAVTDELPGANGSLWVTVVKIVKVNPRDTVTLHRKWVCVPGGGFVDDPDTGPSWTLETGSFANRLALVWGGELLVGAGSSVGGIALEVEGGEVLGHAYVADVSRGLNLPPNYSFGQGQLIPAYRDALDGPSFIPWLAGCENLPCSADPPAVWDHMRNNIGLLNPNPQPLTVTGTALAFSSNPAAQVGSDDDRFVKEVPPYGWVQFHWQADGIYGSDQFGVPYQAGGGFIMNLTPDKDLPYYAYASVVFSPDPESGIPAFSDPMYVPAEPGYVPAMTEVPKASGGDSVSGR
jgi:hypothetical protein